MDLVKQGADHISLVGCDVFQPELNEKPLKGFTQKITQGHTCIGIRYRVSEADMEDHI